VALGTNQKTTRFFDPRHDHWLDHFTFLAGSKYLYIAGVSPEGRATELGLGFDDPAPWGDDGRGHRAAAVAGRRWLWAG